MLIAAVGVLGVLAAAAWLVIAWQSRRRQPWLLAPLPVGAAVLLAFGQAWWALLPVLALAAASFAELVIGAREPPSLRAGHPDAPLSTERWAAAVAAPYRVAAAAEWDVVAHRGLRRRYRRALAEEFGAEDRATLLAAMDRLWEELDRGPGVDLAVDLRTGIAASRGHAPRDRSMLLSTAQVDRVRLVTGAGERAERVVIREIQWWRAVHLVRLACGGAALDWLSLAETDSQLHRIAAALQRRYVSWQQLAQAFHGGYLLWYGGRERLCDTERRLWTALGLLASDPGSPWNQLPWDMPLERPGEGRPAPSTSR